ncbi:AAA domain-containing protein [Mucidula mucida]|nr:AAA domain-containing protein [Mucidula mucida]
MSVQSGVPQTLIPGLSPAQCPDVKLLIVSEADITEAKIKAFIRSANPIGISVGYNPKGHLEIVSCADRERCLIFSVFTRRDRDESDEKQEARMAKRVKVVKLLEKFIFCREAGEVFAFNMRDVAMSLLDTLGLHIARGVNIDSAFRDPRDPGRIPDPLECIKACVGDSIPVEKTYSDLRQRAWAAQFVALYQNAEATFSPVKRIHTQGLTPELLDTIKTMVETTRQVGALQPTNVQHQYISSKVEGAKALDVEMKAYSNRFRRDQEIRVVQKTASGDTIVRSAVSGSTMGKHGAIVFGDSRILNDNKTLTSIVSTSRAGPTNAELRTKEILLNVLEGNFDVFRANLWVCNILMPLNDQPSWPADWFPSHPPFDPVKQESHPARQHLNRSQQAALDHMLSVNPVTIVQGPPGTGKTSVIAAYVQTALDLGHSGIWLIAQSNVAVKNIAEKLLKVGFTAWRLLVSNDFKDGWHDHLYTDLTSYIITSEEFRQLPSHRITGVKVYLSTLSMLSSRKLSTLPEECPFGDSSSTRHLRSRWQNISTFSLPSRKLSRKCALSGIQSSCLRSVLMMWKSSKVFLRFNICRRAGFFSIHNRMPPQLGDFISRSIYSGQLKSWDKHPVTEDIQALYLINVKEGKERKTQAESFENIAEAAAIITLAEHLQNQNTSYKIITPYDGQRNLIENKLREQELQWENTCFNVDSFQGNEEDTIIISVVRSRSIGFLKSLRRTNVMLTRCKRQMFVFTSKSFLEEAGKESLVGGLAENLGEAGWVSLADVVEGRV